MIQQCGTLSDTHWGIIAREIYSYALTFASIICVLILSNRGFNALGIEHNLAIVLSLISIPFFSFLFTSIHELGHALAVKIVGYRLYKVHVHSFEIRFKPFRLKRHTYDGTNNIAGFVIYIPNYEKWSRLKDIIVLLGGSGLVSLIGYIAFLISFHVIDYEVMGIVYHYKTSYLSAFQIMLSLMSAQGAFL